MAGMTINDCQYCKRQGWYDMNCIDCAVRHCKGLPRRLKSWDYVKEVAIKYGHGFEEMKEKLGK